MRPNDTVIYLGGYQIADDHGFKAGHRYKVQTQDKYLIVAHDTNEVGVILSECGEPSEYGAEEYFKLDDGLALSRIEPKPECNCHAMFSPKGCSSWCNTQPMRKVS